MPERFHQRVWGIMVRVRVRVRGIMIRVRVRDPSGVPGRIVPERFNHMRHNG